MTQITVEIPKEQDLDSLLALLRQMNLRVVVKRSADKNPKHSTSPNVTTIKEQLLAKPMSESFDKEAIKQAQNWKGQHDKAGMMKLIMDMDVQEPSEKLLSQISR